MVRPEPGVMAAAPRPHRLLGDAEVGRERAGPCLAERVLVEARMERTADHREDVGRALVVMLLAHWEPPSRLRTSVGGRPCAGPACVSVPAQGHAPRPRSTARPMCPGGWQSTR